MYLRKATKLNSDGGQFVPEYREIRKNFMHTKNSTM